jgi:hypoxanthine phosphoribosyltransferase
MAMIDAPYTQKGDPPMFDVLVTPEEIAARTEALAKELAPFMRTGEWTLVCILLGATPFAADLMRALARAGVHPAYDALWLESYHEARESSGRVVVRADLSKSVVGRGILLVDDVYDSGRTIAFARTHVLAKGAREVRVCALASKPGAPSDGVEHCGFSLPDRFLVGYGMDDGGLYRGLPYVGAVDAD